MSTTIQISSAPDDVDCVVIGAGVVGLAIARELAADGREVIIIEREAQFGSVTSSRNSEVIHAGIYYPEGTLKARLCVKGRERLYRFCEQFGVAHRRCGKLIVATQAQLSELESIDQHSRNNGVEDLRALDARAVSALEPALAGAGAMLSPSTGIIDSHGFMLTLLGLAEADGATLVCQTEVTRLEPTAAGMLVYTGGADATVLRARTVINAAGLNAPDIAANTTGLYPQHVPAAHYARGNYFVLEGPNPFSRLIYPVPEPGGLGIHLTLDLAGRARFGPDVEWVDAPDQRVNAARVDTFYERIRSYWPALPDGALAPGYAGVRPKISGPGEPAADFRIDGPGTHGIEGLVNLFGIESPGLTASLAIASHVARMPSILA